MMSATPTRTKRLRRRQWDASSVIEVTLTPGREDPERMLVTYKGQDIGHIEPVWSRLDRRSKRRKFWVTGDYYGESQAAAIRALLRGLEGRTHPREEKATCPAR